MALLRKISIIFILLNLMIVNAVAAVTANASVSHKQIFLGDIFYLNIEVNDTGSQYQLNTSALTDDFTVYRPSRKEQQAYINGNYTATTSWSIKLQAKQTGEFTIPSLNIGKVATQPITITVSQPGKQQESSSQDRIFIENSVDKTQVYLDQPILLTTNIFISGQLNDGDIQPPQLAGAEIQRTGKEEQSQLIRNGIRYRVFTYQYQISPSIIGEDKISSPLLIGSVRKSVPINDWQNKIIAEPINIRGNSIDITVKAIPQDFQGDWLVSEDVRLVENTDLQAKQYKVGEPITRSISLQVASIPMEQMPEIKLGYDKSLRYYPDQDELNQGTAGNLLYSQRTISHAIIASESGTLVLPKISIPWWNSVTDKQEFATIPAQVLTILPADKQAATATPAPAEVVSSPAKINSNRVERNDSQGELLIWQLISLTLLLLLIAFAIYHYRYQQTNKSADIKVEPVTSNNEYSKLLTLLTKNAQPNQVYAALLRYIQSQQPALTQLQQIVTYSQIDENQKQQLLDNLQQLEQACAGKSHQWDAKSLIPLIKAHQNRTKNPQSQLFQNINP